MSVSPWRLPGAYRQLLARLPTLVVLTACGLLPACVPLPHFEPLLPPISGVVTEAGQPVRGALVFVDPRPCSPELAESVAVTDDNGRYAYSGQTRFAWVYMVEDPVTFWRLSVRRGETLFLGQETFHHGLSDRPVRLDVELSTAKVQDGDPCR